MNNFKNQKQNQLSKKDKSNIKEIDRRIISLCETLNKSINYYTTSSCSGRIILIRASEKKIPDIFLFRTHRRTSTEEIKKQLEKLSSNQENNGEEFVYFKLEPAALHVACRNIESAQILLNKARNIGFKKSGIIASKTKIICQLFSTEALEMPVIETGKILISEDFLKLLVKEANKKLEKGWWKIRKLEDSLE